MKKYLAFLRGINVGGKNKLAMPALKAMLEQNGFYEVKTYINSGNVIFSSDNTNEDILKNECEAWIKDRFQLSIPVTIVSVEDLSEALAHKPAWWNEDKEAKHNVIFVIPPVTPEEVFEKVGEAKPEYEKAAYYGRVIFWSAPIQTFSRTRWSKVVQSSVYNSITIRNANTINKLMQLV